jgi:hypothetical protein
MTAEQLPESKLLTSNFWSKSERCQRYIHYRMPDGEYGRVIETVNI